MTGLHRHLAPLSDTAWAEIEEEATRTLTTFLAGRKLVDFVGPEGYGCSSVSLGSTKEVSSGIDGVQASLRQVQPLVEIRVPFQLSRIEMEAIDRGEDGDLGPVVEAAKKLALTEDGAVFLGAEGAGIAGIAQCAKSSTVTLSDDYQQYAASVSKASHILRSNGIGGPYALALGPRCHQGLHTTFSPAGLPLVEQVRNMIDGPIVWAPAMDGAVLMSLRGGDFELTVGQDVSIGYLSHDDRTVTLFLRESFTFRCLSPEAAVPLRYA